MRHDGRIARALRQSDGGKRFGQGADLIDLDQDRIGDAFGDPTRETRDIGDEKIVADELAFLAEHTSEELPAVPIVLGHRVLDRNDRIVRDKLRQIPRLLLRRACLAFARVNIFAVAKKFGRGTIDPKGYIFTKLEARALDRRAEG